MFCYRLQCSQEDISQATGNFSNSSGLPHYRNRKYRKSTKAALFRAVIGPESLEVLKPTNLSLNENQDSKTCLQALENYFKSAKNEVYERFKFYTCDQGPNDFVDECLTRLRHLLQSCNFGATLDSMLRDHLILGTKDKKAEAICLEKKC